MARRAKRKWNEANVTRDENGRFVAWSMHIEAGGKTIRRSGPDTPSPRTTPRPAVNPYTNQPYAPGMTPGHQRLIDMKGRWDQQMFRNQQNNQGARRRRKPKTA